MVEGQPTEVEDAEQDVSDGGGDCDEKVPHFDDNDREQTFSNEILKIIQRSTAPLFWSYYWQTSKDQNLKLLVLSFMDYNK